MSEEAEKIPYGAMVPEKETPELPPEEENQPEQPEERLYAGKYKTVEDLEKGYKEFGKTANEVGELRKQNQTLAQQMEELKKTASAREEKARDLPPPTDYEKMLRDVAKKYDEGEITYEQSLLETNKLTREWTKAEAEQEKAALLEQARSEVLGILSQKDTEVAVNQWHDKNPDFRALQESGELERLKAEDPVLDDLSAYYKMQAAKAREEGKAEAMRLAAGSQKAGKVIADPGTSMQQPRQSNKPMSENEIKSSMLAQLKG